MKQEASHCPAISVCSCDLSVQVQEQVSRAQIRLGLEGNLFRVARALSMPILCKPQVVRVSCSSQEARCACRWLAQLLANVGLKHPDPMFAEITEPTQPLPLPPPE